MNAKNVTYLGSFGVEHVPKKVEEFIENKNIITNIYRIQACNLKMWNAFVLDLLILC